MLRLLRVADAAGFVIANKVNRATDDTKSFRDLYDASAEFELDRPLLSVMWNITAVMHSTVGAGSSGASSRGSRSGFCVLWRLGRLRNAADENTARRPCRPLPAFHI